MKTILIILGALVALLILARIIKKFIPIPAPAYIGRALDSAFRRFFQSPGAILERSGIRPGMTVMELGCGSGAYTTYMARAIGERGKLYAVDIQAAMLKQLERKLGKAENQDIGNVELRKAGAYELPFAADFFDLVCIVTVLMEIPDRGWALREVKRVLKPGGILAVTELFLDPDYPFRSTVVKLGRGEGFTLDGSKGNFWHYTVRFKKPSSS